MCVSVRLYYVSVTAGEEEEEEEEKEERRSLSCIATIVTHHPTHLHTTAINNPSTYSYHSPAVTITAIITVTTEDALEGTTRAAQRTQTRLEAMERENVLLREQNEAVKLLAEETLSEAGGGGPSAFDLSKRLVHCREELMLKEEELKAAVQCAQENRHAVGGGQSQNLLRRDFKTVEDRASAMVKALEVLMEQHTE
jgi:hypothetical protein